MGQPQYYPVNEEPRLHARTKHIEVHYHFGRERVISSEVELLYVPTDRQVDDIFTKPIRLDKLRHFSDILVVPQYVALEGERRKIG